MSKLKCVLIFAAGAAAGSLATYYITREKWRIQAEEEIQSVREIYMKRDAEEMKESRKEEGIVEQTEEELVDYYLERLKELGVEYVTQEDYDERERVNPVDDEEEDEAPEEYPDTPEQVDKDEFYNGWDSYEFVTLTMYAGDGTVVDEVEDIVDNIRDYVGNFDLSTAKGGDVLYFVNHAMMFKIEIEVLAQSYKRDVLGEDDGVEWGDPKPE